MKRIIFLISLTVLIAMSMDAQSYYKVPTSGYRTITAVDTIKHNNVPSKIQSFSYTYIETSGTTAGKIILEATNDTLGNWKPLDSLTLADVATPQSLNYTVTKTYFGYYRFRNTNTSSATGSVRSVMLRRFDE